MSHWVGTGNHQTLLHKAVLSSRPVVGAALGPALLLEVWLTAQRGAATGCTPAAACCLGVRILVLVKALVEA